MVVSDEQVSRHLLRNLPIRMARGKPVDLVSPWLALDRVCCVDSHLLRPRLVELALHRASRAYLEAESHCSADRRVRSYARASEGRSPTYSVRKASIGSRLAAI